MPLRLGSAFQNVLNFSFALHQNQVRKTGDVPYFAHLMAVAALVLDYGGDETMAVAALLHDAIEDQGGEPTGAVIEHIFGKEVAELVRDCSEKKGIPWSERKQAFVQAIGHKNAGARLICAADKVHNVRTILGTYRSRGEDVWNSFRGGWDSLWFYDAVLNALKTAATEADPPQLGHLVEELERTLRELQRLKLGTRTTSFPSSG